MEDLAVSAAKLPGARRRLVDQEKLSELVDQMRVAIPKDVLEAEEVLARREDLLNQALVEARRIRTSAESEFRSRVDDSELVKEGEGQASKIVEAAQNKAQRILDLADSDAKGRQAASDQYSQDVLYQLEQQIAGILSTVRHGIDTLDVQEKTTAG